MAGLWARLSHETNYSQYTPLTDFVYRTLLQRAIESPVGMRSKISGPSGISYMILQKTTSIFPNLPPDPLIVTTTQHHHFVRYSTITEKHRRKYIRSPCNAWAFSRRGKEWVVSRSGRLVIKLGFKACLSANLTWSSGSVQPNTHTHTHRANESTDDKALMKPVT